MAHVNDRWLAEDQLCEAIEVLRVAMPHLRRLALAGDPRALPALSYVRDARRFAVAANEALQPTKRAA